MLDAFRVVVLATDEPAGRRAPLRLLVRFDDLEERDAALLRLEAPDFFELFLEAFEPVLLRDVFEAAADLPADRFTALFLAPLFLAPLFLAPPFFAPPLLFLELDDLDDFFLLPLFLDDDFFAADFFAAIGVLLFQTLSVGEPYVFEIRDRAAWQLGCTKPM